MSAKIKIHILSIAPQLKPILDQCATIPRIKSKNDNVLDAVIKAVVGQMLSLAAANTIYNRINIARKADHSYTGLKEAELRACGVSQRKALTIIKFAELYSRDPQRFLNWENLSYDELRKEVNQIWGISDWTASMLAIFTFGLEDVFPERDGTIKRAIDRLEARGVVLVPDEFSPYRSYLALYLWAMIDDNLI